MKKKLFTKSFTHGRNALLLLGIFSFSFSDIAAPVDLSALKNHKYQVQVTNNFVEVAPGLEYRFAKRLGEGTFGEVYLMELRSPKGSIQVAAKVPKSGTPEKMVDAEVAQLEALKSDPYVMPYLGTIPSTSNQKIILAEVMASDLKGWKRPLTKKNIIDLFEGLTSLKNRQIVHNDIKPANLFIDTAGDLMIGDVGGATKGKLGETSTAEFSPPERFSTDHGDIYKSDVYSAGVTLWQKLKKKEAFDLKVLKKEKEKLDRDIQDAIKDGEPLDDNFIDLIKSQLIRGKVSSDPLFLTNAIREELDTSKPVESLIYKALNPDNSKRPTAKQMATYFSLLQDSAFDVFK